MRNNLKMVLNGTLGSSRMFDAEDMIVRVGWVAIPGELFTWSQRLQHGCPACGRTTDLIFLSSNAMFYLLRLLQTAAALFVAVPDDSGRPLVRCRSEASDDLIHQVHLAMEIYRGHRELSPAGLGELSRLFGTAPNPAQLAAAEMYHATVAWMLMHEVGHTVGPAPQARRYLDAQSLPLDPGRATRWIDELSSDINASTLLSVAFAARSESAESAGPDALMRGWNLGFGGGVVALMAFELYEGYDAGARATSRERDGSKALAFRTHPPLRYRQHFLETTRGPSGTPLNPDVIRPWRESFDVLFSEYVDRYPIPD
jgi:hypothetical protein